MCLGSVTSPENKKRRLKKEMKWNVKRTLNEGTRGEINDAFNFQ